MSLTPDNSNESMLPSTDVVAGQAIVESPAENELLSQVKPVPAEVSLDLNRKAADFAASVRDYTPGNIAYTEKINQIRNIAAREITAAASAPSRMLERSSTSYASSKKSGSDGSKDISKTMLDLRHTVADLTPKGDLNGVQKILGFIPGRKKAGQWLAKYESSKSHLDAITVSLLQGRDDLIRDNADLEQEKIRAWDQMGELNKAAVLTGGIDRELVAVIDDLKAAGKEVEAKAVESDMLFPVRKRRQDILTQLTVSWQSFMVMELIRANNLELIEGLQRSKDVTLAALQTAIMAATALENQKANLDKMDALDAAANNAISSVGDMLKSNTTRIHARASSSGVDPETLKKAFNDIITTIDQMENFKVEANKKMDVTINALTAEVERTRPYGERMQAIAASEGDRSSYKALGQ
jgi:uncharacterized protein YaaN involved in tellurite resistance